MQTHSKAKSQLFCYHDRRLPPGFQRHVPILTDTAVVWALGTWETTLGPSVWGTVVVEEGVFLLNTEPRLVLSAGIHGLLA